jgi:ATP-binding cassette, subfamily B, bacterial
MTLHAAGQAWHQAVLAPRWKIVRLLPSAGPALIAGLLVANAIIGSLPVAFILTTSALVGHVPAAVASGVGSSAFSALLHAFWLTSICFLAQQCLMAVQVALGECVKQRVDGVLRDQTMGVVMQSPGIAPMEDKEMANALSELTRLLESAYTPGSACAGLLALVARYVRLLGLLCVIGRVTSWPSALAVGATTLLFRYGNRGGLRKYSVVWRDVAGISRRAQHLRELTMGAAAAKEIRIFGLAPWLSQRYAETYSAAVGRVAARRREIYLGPYVLFTSVGLLVSTAVAVSMARHAIVSAVPLSDVALGLQALVMALLLGDFYPESDVPTQNGMRAVAALDEVRARLAAHAAGTSRKGAPVAASLPSRCIRFEHVVFRYPGAERNILDGLTLELPAGKCTAIVGVNGAGKTTLVKLLTRLYAPTAGAISADGADIGQLDARAWRRQISVIFQDFIRYELSCADNIALGAAHVPRDVEALRTAAQRAGILDHFAQQPLGLETPLGRAYTAGVELSGGQWQRVAIARSFYALLAGAQVLVLDEPTSALDVRAEAAFFDQFMDLTRGVTSVLISHRFSSVRRANHIIVIDGGRVVEQGTHAELVLAGARYAELFRLQAECFSEAAAVPSGGRSLRAAAPDLQEGGAS